MERINKGWDNIIQLSLVVIIILSCTTGWSVIDDIGMSKFWAIFMLISLVLTIFIIKKIGLNKAFHSFFKSKLNIIALIYLLWTSITYLINYTDKSSLLYIFKMWFIVLVYLGITQIYFNSLNKEEGKSFINKCCKAIFFVGLILCVIGIYQFVFSKNQIFGIVLTDWPTYNPASMYGNVNGFGTYLYISIVSGLYCLINSENIRAKAFMIFGIVLQSYMLYLTVARTSIVASIIFIIGSLAVYNTYEKKEIRKLFSKKNISTFIIANLIMVSMLNISDIKFMITHIKSTNRTASDMMAEKNSKGVNSRQFIWEAVFKNYKEYITFGDGLKYNVIKKINVEEVISERSKGVSRISYHNTLVRYFASNGTMGLILFLFLFGYAPLMLVFQMIRGKRISVKYLMLVLFLISVFFYMQMEEVYIGEIGLVPLVTMLAMSFSCSVLENEKI